MNRKRPKLKFFIRHYKEYHILQNYITDIEAVSNTKTIFKPYASNSASFFNRSHENFYTYFVCICLGDTGKICLCIKYTITNLVVDFYRDIDKSHPVIFPF